MREIDAKRTEKAASIIKEFGGNLVEALILIGNYDLALCLELPGISEAVQVSVALTKLTGISFQTYPAITVAEFDRMIASMK
jgi:uncharacterized protein with GYD domain